MSGIHFMAAWKCVAGLLKSDSRNSFRRNFCVGVGMSFGVGVVGCERKIIVLSVTKHAKRIHYPLYTESVVIIYRLLLNVNILAS